MLTNMVVEVTSGKGHAQTTLTVKRIRCCEAKIERMKRPAVATNQTQDTWLVRHIYDGSKSLL